MFPNESCMILIAFSIIICDVQSQILQGVSDVVSQGLRDITNLGNGSNGSFLHINTDDIRLRCTTDELIDYYGYIGEKHTVITDDGYILTLHRIAGKNTNANIIRKPVVLLQHGILCSSIDWIIGGPARSLAFLLSDFGLDVWLGNSRGNTYSCAHVNMTSSEEDFWDFSWHELAIYDLPATINYILAKTKNRKLTYIGHSQGTTISYVLLSERPEYNKKISLLISLAPVAFGVPASKMAPFVRLIHRVTNSTIMQEFPELNRVGKRFVFYYCNKDIATSRMCKQLMFFLGGSSEKLYDEDLYPIIFQHFPAGASMKQIAHYAQLTQSGHFRQFDYKSDANMIRYGSIDPPDYKVENIKVPTTLYVGKNDLLSAIEEAKKLYNLLPNKNGLKTVSEPTFSHFDFLWAIGVRHLLYEDVLSVVLSSLFSAS